MMAALALSSCILLPPKKSSSSSSSEPTTTSTSGTSSSTTTSDIPAEVTVTLSKTSISLDVYNSKTVEITATVKAPAGADTTVAWRMDNASFATVKASAADDKVATVTALAKGSTTLRATVTYNKKDYSAACPVSVADSTPKDPVITKVTFNVPDKNPLLDVNDEKEYQANVSGTDGTSVEYNRKSSFVCSDPTVLEMTEIQTGAKEGSKIHVKALKGGNATITATAIGDTTKTDVLSFTVLPTIVSIDSVVSHPSTVAKDAAIDPSTVILKVNCDDSTQMNVAAFSVTCDTSTVGVKEATAYAKGVTEGINFNITVYEGQEDTYTFTDKNFNDATSSFNCITAGNGFDASASSARGIQVSTGNTAKAESKESIGGIRSVSIVSSANGGKGTITIKVGTEKVLEKTYDGETEVNVPHTEQLTEIKSGVVSIEIKNTGASKSVYLKSISISKEHVQDGIAVLTPGKTSYNVNDYFDFTGYVVVPHYTDGPGTAAEAISHDDLTVSFASDYQLQTTDTKVTISLKNSTYTVDYPIMVGDALTITITGDLTKNSYELTDTWSDAGLTATGSYTSGAQYTLGFDVSYSPATPQAMGVGDNQDLTITYTAKDGSGTHESVVKKVSVTNPVYTNTTNLADGVYYIGTPENGYLSSVKTNGEGTLNSDKTEALSFEFKLVGNDTWTIKNNDKYLTIGATSTSLSLSDAEATLAISWDDEASQTRRIYSASSNRALAVYGEDSLRTYSISGSGKFGMVLDSGKAVASITEIVGKVTAKLNAAWDTSNITVNGLLEGETTPVNVTPLVDLTCDPATATSDSITSVSVTATLKTDSSITYTHSVTAEVAPAAAWQQVSSIAAGSQIVIVNNAKGQVLTGVNSDNIGTNADFDESETEQACILVVEAGSKADTFAFKWSTNNKYLAYTDSTDKSNKLYTLDAVQDESSWTISFDSDGNVTMTNVKYTTRILKYNAGSPRFCCYTSAQSSIQFYSK